jgi:hypothetical protein
MMMALTGFSCHYERLSTTGLGDPINYRRPDTTYAGAVLYTGGTSPFIMPRYKITSARLAEMTRSIATAGGSTTALEDLAEWLLRPDHEIRSRVPTDGGNYWRLKILSDTLRATGVSVNVPFNATGGAGARVRYRLMTDDGEPQTATKLTNHAGARMSCGLYYIWTERGGKPTSSKDAWFTVVPDMAVPIDLDER